ncbi:MAG: hypothetical protein PHE49_06790 [bacterium]|nr:hypothetical protein [bacterium]
MILKDWPMDFRGTIKGITPEQAKEMFDYDMPPDAKGISFRFRNNKTETLPYYPEKYTHYINRSPEFMAYQKIFSAMNKIAFQIRDTIIRPLWDIMAAEKKYWSGFNMFMSMNCKQMRAGIENIFFTLGNLLPPQILSIEITDSYIELQLKNSKPEYQLGIIVLNSETLEVKQSLLKYPYETITIPIQIKNSIVFLYYKNKKNYSPSVCIYPTL